MLYNSVSLFFNRITEKHVRYTEITGFIFVYAWRYKTLYISSFFVGVSYDIIAGLRPLQKTGLDANGGITHLLFITASLAVTLRSMTGHRK